MRSKFRLLDERRRAASAGHRLPDAPSRPRLWSLACVTLAIGLGALLLLLLFQPSLASARKTMPPPVHYCNAHGQPRGCVHVPKAAKRPPKSVNEQGGPTLTPPSATSGGVRVGPPCS